MSTTDTPETDAAIKASNGQWSYAVRELCRRIERERDDLKRMLDLTTRQLNKALDEIVRLRIEKLQ